MNGVYSIKEIFYSPQGEGHRAGTMNIFVRFAGCNLQCVTEKEGFNCDTNFRDGYKMTTDEILVEMLHVTMGYRCKSVILTGGEPTLQIDDNLLETLKVAGYFIAIETNATRKVHPLVDYIACSPKPGHPPAISRAQEVRCVVREGVAPDPADIVAENYFVSPAAWAPDAETVHSGKWQADASTLLKQKRSIAWCVEWCRRNPTWRISLQTHKLLGVR